MPRNEKVTIANPESKDAQKALDEYRPTVMGHVTTLIVLINSMTVLVSIASGTLAAGELVAVLLYALWGGVVLALGLIKLKERRLRQRYERHVAAGNIVTLDAYVVHTWDELRREAFVPLNAAERFAEIQKLFAAAAELHDDLQSRAVSEGNPDLAETRLLAEARIRARLLREVERLRAVQDAQRELAQLPGPQIDIVTPEEVDAQLRELRARRTAQTDAQEG